MRVARCGEPVLGMRPQTCSRREVRTRVSQSHDLHDLGGTEGLGVDLALLEGLDQGQGGLGAIAQEVDHAGVSVVSRLGHAARRDSGDVGAGVGSEGVESGQAGWQWVRRGIEEESQQGVALLGVGELAEKADQFDAVGWGVAGFLRVLVQSSGGLPGG